MLPSDLGIVGQPIAPTCAGFRMLVPSIAHLFMLRGVYVDVVLGLVD